MARLTFLLFLLGALISLASAASAPTFCKCTCFTNSTIIALGPAKGGNGGTTPPPPAKDPPPADDSTGKDPSAGDGAQQTSISGRAAAAAAVYYSSSDDAAFLERRTSRAAAAIEGRAASSSCSQCNRAFCLGYNLPICEGAGEKDVVTMCFQRDSRKDQIIVWGFILGTAGLLGWAAVKKVLEAREGKGLPVFGSLGGGGGGGIGRGLNIGGAAGRTSAFGSAGLQRRSPTGGNEANRGLYSPVGDLDGSGVSGERGPG